MTWNTTTTEKELVLTFKPFTVTPKTSLMGFIELTTTLPGIGLVYIVTAEINGEKVTYEKPVGCETVKKLTMRYLKQGATKVKVTLDKEYKKKKFK